MAKLKSLQCQGLPKLGEKLGGRRIAGNLRHPVGTLHGNSKRGTLC